jgi:transcription antitermination factor NusG
MIQSVTWASEAEKIRERKWDVPGWYAVYTKGRHEKFLDGELRKKQIESYLPVRKVTRNWSDRKKIIEDPLFKSYLFVKIPWRQRYRVLNTVGAVCFVTSGLSHDPIEVPEKDLEAIRRFTEEGMATDPFPYLKAGERVYIRSGPFKGVEGFVVRKDSHCRLVISLDALMQSISIRIDEACVEKS